AAGPRRLRLHRRRRRKPVDRRSRGAGQKLPDDHGRTDGAPHPGQAPRRLRAGEPDRGGRRRGRRGRALARAARPARRLGERSGAALPLSRLARLPQALGPARRPRLGAGARALPPRMRALQRPAGGAAEALARAGAGLVTPRRVLMTADAVGGVWTYAVELANVLARRGVTTALAVMGPPPSAGQRAAAAQVPGLTLLHAPYRLEWSAGCEVDLDASADWLLGLESRFAADLVHVNGFWHASL